MEPVCCAELYVRHGRGLSRRSDDVDVLRWVQPWPRWRISHPRDLRRSTSERTERTIRRAPADGQRVVRGRDRVRDVRDLHRPMSTRCVFGGFPLAIATTQEAPRCPTETDEALFCVTPSSSGPTRQQRRRWAPTALPQNKPIPATHGHRDQPAPLKGRGSMRRPDEIRELESHHPRMGGAPSCCTLPSSGISTNRST